VKLIPSDERLVPEDSPQSNTGMIRRNLIENIKGGDEPELFSILNGNDPNKTEKIVSSINCRTKHLLPPRAAFLGIGKDGHTASLFHDSKHDTKSGDQFQLVDRSGESYQRITVSFSVLINTPMIIYLVSGNSKKYSIESILYEEFENFKSPVRTVIEESKGDVLILCDRDASPSNI